MEEMERDQKGLKADRRRLEEHRERGRTKTENERRLFQ